ncbi:MAG: peptidylprolyl isomerase [Opitutaceae bacterium]|nr:peptidylprolyl isomerase [Opitutaceae bacterium]
MCRAQPPATESVPLADGIYAEFGTPRGDFVCELFYDQVPLTVANFTGLAEGKLGPEPRRPFYDGLKFHRVVPDFVVQGGDPLGTGEGGPGYEFSDEFAPGLKHAAVGVLSMANAGPDTNGSQFFLTLRPVNRLNYLHSVFGRTVRGAEVLPQIKQGDAITAVRILRVGAAARAFRNDADTFAALQAAAKKYPGRPAPGEDAHFADPGGLLPGEPPRAGYFNYQLANYERTTGLRIFLRLAAKYQPTTPGQRPGSHTGALARQLGFTDTGIVAAWFADLGQWGLWIGPRELPVLMGREGTVKEFMQDSALHHAKQVLIRQAEAMASTMQANAATTYDRPLTAAELLKCRVDATVETLFNHFEPRR